MTSILLEQPKETVLHMGTVGEVAKHFGVSESKIRREIKSLGIRKVGGGVVGGFVRFDGIGHMNGVVDVLLSVSDVGETFTCGHCNQILPVASEADYADMSRVGHLICRECYTAAS